MPKVGDGTGIGSMPPTHEGLTWPVDGTADSDPEKQSGTEFYTPGSGGGAKLEPGGNRTTPVSGSTPYTGGKGE